MGFTACIIGGGPAGIAAALNLRRAGAMVTCMELNSTVGGMWATAHGPTAGSHGGSLPGSGYMALGARGLLSPIYPSMQCVLPKDAMAYSDMRFSFLVPQYPHYAAVHEYLQEYAHRKGVHGLVRYNTWVESVQWLGDDRTSADEPSGVTGPKINHSGVSKIDTTRNGEGKENVWLVRTVNVVNGDVTEWKFDCVVVASGRHHRPRLPDPYNYSAKTKAIAPHSPAVMAPIPGQGRFVDAGGQVLHASEVKRFRDYRGKVVVVYGNGVTAFEYAKELQKAGALVVHATEIERDEDGLDEEAKRTQPSELVASPQRSMEEIRRVLQRYSPLSNPRLVTKILSRRNARLRQSLRATLHGPTGYGDMNRTTKLWERDFHRPKPVNPATGAPLTDEEAAAQYEAATRTRVAPPLAESLDALKGAYAQIPVLGEIHRCGAAEDASVPPKPTGPSASTTDAKDTKSGTAATDHAAADPATAVEQPGDRDLIIRIVNPSRASSSAEKYREGQKRGVGAAALDAIADVTDTTDISRVSSMHSPVKLLSLIRKAEYNPYEKRSVALLSRFRLMREKTGSQEVTGLCVKHVDAIICCTGYYQAFPFLRDPSIRADVEFSSRRPHLRLAGRAGEADADASPEESDEPERRRVLYKNLYMGTLLRRNPTLSFIGLQSEVVPPFLLFEAQSAYIASVLAGRVTLPPSELEMDRRELELGIPNRKLANVRGLGIGGSADFYTALLHETNLVHSHYGYYETMWNARRLWFAGSWIVKWVHRLWSFTPQKRKQQHVIISNDV
jgi:cation diffusion facilitator CzcD-associated flavoprotein CzcO